MTRLTPPNILYVSKADASKTRRRFILSGALAAAGLGLNLAMLAGFLPISFLWALLGSFGVGLYFLRDPSAMLCAMIGFPAPQVLRLAVYAAFILPAALFALGSHLMLDAEATKPVILLSYAFYFAVMLFGSVRALRRPAIGELVVHLMLQKKSPQQPTGPGTRPS